MKTQPSNQSRKEALVRILQAISSRLGKGAMYTTAILGMAALIPGLDLPGILGTIATGVGVEAIGIIIDRVANNSAISDDEIKRQVESALNQSEAIDQLLTKDDFWHAFDHLRKGQRSLGGQNKMIYELLRRIEHMETSDVVIVDGIHQAEGNGEVTGIDVQGPAIFRPGTKSTASGTGTITATRIGGKKESHE